MAENMRRIDIDTLLSWSPCYSESWCKERMPKGYLTPLQVARHGNVTTLDKLWVLLRPEILPEQSLRLLAADFAGHVLLIFESEFPNCPHPRIAIRMARLFAFGKVTTEELAAVGGAARAAEWAAAGAAARAAEKQYQLERVVEYLRGNVNIEAIKRKAMREQRRTKETTCA